MLRGTRVVRSLLFILLFALWTTCVGVVCLPVLAMTRPMGVAVARFWLKGGLVLLRAVCGLSYTVRGTPPTGAALVVSKHQSTLETFAFRQILPDPAVVLKRELLRIPIFGWYLWKSGVIAIDRSAGVKALHQMVSAAKQAMAEERAVLMFPEGTRTAVGQPADYHSGVAMLYSALNCPVVPVALNTGVYWGRGQVGKRPGQAVIEFLDPIPAGLPRKEFMAVLQQRIEDATARLVAEAQVALTDKA